MAHLGLIPLLEGVADAALPLFASAAAGVAVGSVRKTQREGIFKGGTLNRKRMKRAAGPSSYKPKRLKFSPVSQTAARPSRYRSQLGRPIGRFSTRRHTVTFDGTAFSDRVQSVHRLINIPFSEDETLINRRRSNLVNVRGVRLRVQLKLDRTLAATHLGAKLPLDFRWAIINPKNNDGSLPANFNDEFWIARNPGEQMSKDFSSTSNYWTYFRDQINKEKYGVLKEGTFKLTPVMYDQGVSSTGSGKGNGFSLTAAMNAQIECYIPIMKQMKFENNVENAGQHPETNIYFVMWYTDTNSFGDSVVFDGTTDATIPFSYKWETTTFFTNAAMYK